MEPLKTAHLEQFKAFGSQGLLVLTLTAVKSYILSVMGKKPPKQKSSLKPPPVQVPISKRFMINQVDYACVLTGSMSLQAFQVNHLGEQGRKELHRLLLYRKMHKNKTWRPSHKSL